jgi:hypothetical protein
VLPIYDDLLKGFEDARERHLLAASQRLADSQAAPEASSLTLTQPPGYQRITRRGQRIPTGQTSVSAIDSEGGTTPAATQVGSQAEVTKNITDNFAESQIGTEFLSLEHHFTHNINAAWQKLEHYYNLSDNTPIYRAAVFLHPRMKWRWFERY